MSQENVDVVQSIYASLDCGDWDAAFRLVDPDFEVTFQRGPNAGTHRGRDTIQAIIKDQREAFDAWTIEVERVFERGDQVVVVIKSHLRPKGTDAEFEMQRADLDDPGRRGGFSPWLSKPQEALEPPGCGSSPLPENVRSPGSASAVRLLPICP